MDQSNTQGPFTCRGGSKGLWLIAASFQASEAVPQAVGFILRPQRATELPPTLGGPGSGLSSFGGIMGGPGVSLRKTGPTSWQTLGESEALYGPWFPICKMGVIPSGSDEIIKRLAWCQVR